MVSESFHRSIGAARMVKSTTTAMFFDILSVRFLAMRLVELFAPPGRRR